MIAVYVEQHQGTVPKSSLAAISAARSAREAHREIYEGKNIVAILVGADGLERAAETVRRAGVDEVVLVNHPALSPYLALNHARAVVEFLRQEGSAQLVLMAATTLGKDLAPRIAAAFDAALASDVLAFLPGGHFRRLMYAGNIVAEVELLTGMKAGTVRPTAFEAPALDGSPAPVRTAACFSEPDSRTRFVRFDTVQSERPELTEADIVVSGGRALKSSENFTQLMLPLADACGAAVGASRAAVDSGYAPNDWQVGQTGKVVAPKLYIAVGISGAIQHLAGMKDSKVIVALNKDSEAPIFEVADYGLVADLFETVPQLTEAIRVARSS